MRYETIKPGEKIPVLGLGTWGMGGGMSPEYSRDKAFVRAIRTAIELGYTHIDTAEMYGGGHTEELVGQAIKAYDRRDLFITTKVSPSHLRYQDVIDSLERSLERLDSDYVDLYLIHWPNETIPLEETFQALNQTVVRGLVRHLGVSNFNLEQIRRAQALSSTHIVTNQVPYSLTDRRYAHNSVLEYCQENGILLTAYSPFKGGVLGNSLVREIARKHGVTPAQVALCWLINQPRVITIPKSDKEQHLRENLVALEVILTEEDLKKLDNMNWMGKIGGRLGFLTY